MKVILINGSPKEKGCTFTALSEVAAQLSRNGIETEIFHIGNKPISACIDCRACKKEGARGCIYSDVNTFAHVARDADGFVFGGPVHYAAIGGALASFMDRLFFAHGKSFWGRPAAAVVVCRRGGSTAALDQLNKYFTICQMPIVSSQYWNMVHGSTPDQTRQDLEGMQTMRVLADNMAWLLNCIEAGKKQGIHFPKHPDRVLTNFIR